MTRFFQAEQQIRFLCVAQRNLLCPVCPVFPGGTTKLMWINFAAPAAGDQPPSHAEPGAVLDSMASVQHPLAGWARPILLVVYMPKSASFLSPIPLFFVFLWSTGFIVAKFGLPYAPPLMFLLLRFLGVLAILLPLVLLMRAPWPHGKIKEVALAGLLMQAGYLAGVTRAFTIGGAQAVGALAYGTETVPRVDKITGPGNAYVASAKRRVFGQVGIDMIAGPSEILVLADGTTPPDWV
eukprot:gene2182-2943_t